MDDGIASVFVWGHRVLIGPGSLYLDQYVCRIRQNPAAELLVMKKGFGWRWQVSRKGLRSKTLADGECAFLDDAISACEETFYKMRDHMADSLSHDLGMGDSYIYGSDGWGCLGHGGERKEQR